MTEDVEKKTYSVRLPPQIHAKANSFVKLMPKGHRSFSAVVEGALCYLFAAAEELAEETEVVDEVSSNNNGEGGRDAE